ncbi:hypothetical protein ACWDRR_00685 [Kitasatospora sp. NPDC003701]
MPAEMRAPLFLQQGRYDALDFRNMIGRTRGSHVGVAGPDALRVEKIDNPTPRVSVASGSIWLPDDTEASHSGAVFFAHLDASIQLQCSTPKPGEGERVDLVVAFADPDAQALGSRIVDVRSTEARFLQPSWYAEDGTRYAAADAAVGGVSQEGANGWSLAVLAETTPGAGDWKVPHNAVRLARVRIGTTGITGIEDVRFNSPGGGIVPQKDTSALAHIRTAPQQGLNEAINGLPEGSMVYYGQEQRMYVVTAPGKAVPVSAPAQVVMGTPKGSDGGWCDDSVMEWRVGAAPYRRYAAVSFGATAVYNYGDNFWMRAALLFNNGRTPFDNAHRWYGAAAELTHTQTHAGYCVVEIPAGVPFNADAGIMRGFYGTGESGGDKGNCNYTGLNESRFGMAVIYSG